MTTKSAGTHGNARLTPKTPGALAKTSATPKTKPAGINSNASRTQLISKHATLTIAHPKIKPAGMDTTVRCSLKSSCAPILLNVSQKIIRAGTHGNARMRELLTLTALTLLLVSQKIMRAGTHGNARMRELLTLTALTLLLVSQKMMRAGTHGNARIILKFAGRDSSQRRSLQRERSRRHSRLSLQS